MSWFEEQVTANFIEVCDRLDLDYETAIDFEFDESDLDADSLRDIAFGVGYVRGLADAYDQTALEIVWEVLP
jgi:hypothetical protein